MYEHCEYGKCDSIWLCAGFGASYELKKLLEQAKKKPSFKGIDGLYGKNSTSAMAQAFLHVMPEYRVTNIKLLLEYGADPNAFLYQGLTPLHMIVSNFLDNGKGYD
jgi:ankyrin repeat protein